MTCPVCDANAALAFPSHPGYRRGQSYDIYTCPACGVAFADPLRSDPAVYEAIYAHAGRVPGYERYARYAATVASSRSPLRLLARSEDVYFAIAQTLAALRLPRGARILELGSGLGYLTYALRRAGYDAQGRDVSEVAVRAARERFGPHYTAANAERLDGEGGYDLVILTETIEHVEDPAALLRAAAGLLAPRGALLLTTPNKDYYGAGVVWHTDPPPVHLWWFSERSMAVLAARCGLRVEYVDFAEYHRAHPWERPPVLPRGVPTYAPVLDERGETIVAVTPPERRGLFPLNRSVVVPLATAIRRMLVPPRRHTVLAPEPRERRPTMAVLAVRAQ